MKRRAVNFRGIAALWMMAAATLILTGVRVGVENARAQQPDDPALLRELAERLLSPPFPGPGGESTRSRLLPGALPTDLPFELPLPPGSRLVGSSVRPSFARGPGISDGGQSITVIMDVSLPVTEVLSFYERALSERGWSAPPFGGGRGPGGFLPSFGFSSSAPYCRGAQGPFLTVNVSSPATGPSDVRVNVESGFGGPCEGPPGPGRFVGPPPEFDLLPSLTAPAGVQIQPTGGGGGGPGNFSSAAIADTGMSVTDLEAHYARQLEAVGWRRQTGRTDGPLAWSIWTPPAAAGDNERAPRTTPTPPPGAPSIVPPAVEPERQGFLYALEGPGKDRRLLHVQVASSGPLGFGPGGGVIQVGTSTSPIVPAAAAPTAAPPAAIAATATPTAVATVTARPTAAATSVSITAVTATATPAPR